MNQPLPYTHILWDFNGTILDDVSVCMQSADCLLAAHGLPLLPNKMRYRALFCFPVEDYYRRLGFDFEKTPFETLSVEWMENYKRLAMHCRIYPDILPALQSLQQSGIQQWILSATEQTLLFRQVSALGILPFFRGLLGLENIHAQSKTGRGILWRQEHPEGRVLMLGDTDHDADTARAIGADCILLTCGHQSRNTLERCPCLFVADSASQALREIGLLP